MYYGPVNIKESEGPCLKVFPGGQTLLTALSRFGNCGLIIPAAIMLENTEVCPFLSLLTLKSEANFQTVLWD